MGNWDFDFKEAASAFMVLFAIIDITGAIPIIIDLKDRGKKIEPFKIAFISFVIFLMFLFGGVELLGFFGVDISSFALAGAVILFVLSTEMIFGVTFFKSDDCMEMNSALVPLVFPLIAGAASFTTLISLMAEYALVNILVAIILNMMVVYLVLKKVTIVEKILGKGGVYILKKIFGIILLAIAIRFVAENIPPLLEMIKA